MKVILFLLVAGVIGISAFHGGPRRKYGGYAKKFNCTVLYEKCTTAGYKKEMCKGITKGCLQTLEKIKKVVEIHAKKTNQTVEEVKKALKEKVKGRKRVGPPDWHKRRHICPKKFCKCFGGLIKCIKRVHNRTMSFETENKYAANYDDSFNEDYSSIRSMSGPPNITHVVKMLWGIASSISRGNATKGCFIRFKKCVMERPKPVTDMDCDEEEEEDEEDDDEEHDHNDEEYDYTGEGDEHDDEEEDYHDKEVESSKRGIWSKIRCTMKKIVMKWKRMLMMGGRRPSPDRPQHGHHHGHRHHGHHHHGHHHRGHHHHGHHHHGHRVPARFRKCKSQGEKCRGLKTKKEKIECFKKVVKCILTACKELED